MTKAMAVIALGVFLGILGFVLDATGSGTWSAGLVFVGVVASTLGTMSIVFSPPYTFKEMGYLVYVYRLSIVGFLVSACAVFIARYIQEMWIDHLFNVGFFLFVVGLIVSGIIGPKNSR